ncbi:uncharacterized protein LOC135955019 [Calliphora vicina]|uniref:uncharacterized protein LOC135955019 n=1 Tax=Calliphora vicina TaxID=7373 RepID=UPI00325B3594
MQNKMNINHNNQLKQTRVRLKPIKKWTVAEEKALIEFLLNNRDVEKPTSQLFYRRFCKESNLNIQWKTVRSKVKNMRYSFYRARDFESETNGVLDNEDTKSMVLKKCGYYHELEQIFGHHVIQLPVKDECFQSEPNNTFDSITIESDNTTDKSDDDNFPTTSKIPEPEMLVIKPNLINLNHCPMNDSEFSIKCEEMGVDVKELRIKDKLKVMELLIKEKRIQLKEKELSSKENIKIHQLNSREKLKILEMEMKERLTMEELKLKYK